MASIASDLLSVGLRRYTPRLERRLAPLLALIREGEGIAAGILESLGVDMLELRDEVVRYFERGEMPLAET